MKKQIVSKSLTGPETDQREIISLNPETPAKPAKPAKKKGRK